jgi:integrase
MKPEDVPKFLSELQARDTMASRALQFAIHTAARRDMVRLALWGEIDLDSNVWTCPRERLKKFTKDLRTPLNDAAMALLRRMDEVEIVRPTGSMPKFNPQQVAAIRRDIAAGKSRGEIFRLHPGVNTCTFHKIKKGTYKPSVAGEKIQRPREHLPSDPIFPAQLNRGSPFIADKQMLAQLRYLGVDDATQHGFRASFKTWATESSKNYPEKVVEVALAHSQGPLDEAYQHSDLFDKRVVLMRDWGRFVKRRSVLRTIVGRTRWIGSDHRERGRLHHRKSRRTQGAGEMFDWAQLRGHGRSRFVQRGSRLRGDNPRYSRS